MNNSNEASGIVKREASATATPGATNNQSSLNDAIQNTTPLNNRPIFPSLEEISIIHDLTGASIKLQVNDVIIKTHEDRISKFAHLNRLIERARNIDPQSDTLTIFVKGGDGLVSEFLDTFELLSTMSVSRSTSPYAINLTEWCASSIDKPKNFNTKTVVSAARISAAYEHPALHAFCIKTLEGLSLSSMERVQIAREVHLNS
ncbi:hypothetical protein OPQ81_009442 [Rhizoctonia solani]|nr:hypothetical protein OPQ81_009442 [Rhizoctonia solani]